MLNVELINDPAKDRGSFVPEVEPAARLHFLPEDVIMTTRATRRARARQDGL